MLFQFGFVGRADKNFALLQSVAQSKNIGICKLLIFRNITMAFQKLTFCSPKAYLLSSKSLAFETQKVSF